MYLYLGQETVIRTDNILGIFDLDNTTVQKGTRDYLNYAEKNGETKYVSFDLPKSFIVTEKDGEREVYLTHLATNTLFKRK